MMQLGGASGSSFKLKIVDYQFPNITDEYHDSNWLIIQVDVIHPKGAWTAVDPCLLTFDVEWLARWLEDVHSNSNKRPECSFLEPCLEFQVEVNEKSKRVLRVYFELEARPIWASCKIAGQRDLWVEFELSEIDLLAVASELRSELAKYPQRVFKHNKPKRE